MAKQSMGIVDKIKSIIRTPDKFFSGIKSENNFMPGIKFYAVITLVYTILYYIATMASPSALTPAMTAAGAVTSWVFGLIFIFIIAGFFHLFVLLFGGKGGYISTFKTFVYASTPCALIGWISFMFFNFGLPGQVIGGLLLLGLFIWDIYLTVKGLSLLHKISGLRAFGALVVAVFVVLVVVAIIAIGALFLFLASVLPSIA